MFTTNSLLKTSVSVAAVATFLAASPVAAADVFGRGSTKDADVSVRKDDSWQGPYVGVGVGYRWESWSEDGYTIPATKGSKAKCKWSGGGIDVIADWDKGTESDCGKKKGDYIPGVKPIPEQNVPGIDEDNDGFLVTGRFGYDWQRDGFVFGPFAEVNWLNMDAKYFAEADFSYAIGGRVGHLINSRLLAYVNGGVELTDYDGLDTNTDPFVGGGLELMVGDGWTLTGEGRWTFDNSDLPSGVEKDDPASVRLIAGKKF